VDAATVDRCIVVLDDQPLKSNYCAAVLNPAAIMAGAVILNDTVADGYITVVIEADCAALFRGSVARKGRQ